MPADRLLVRALIAASGLAVTSAIVMTAAGLVLVGSYLPHVDGVETSSLPPLAQAAVRWQERQLLAATAVLLLSGVVLIGILVWHRRLRSRPSLAALPFVASAATGVVVRTGSWLRWDQLALWSVTVGTNVSGYWYAAFSSRIRFILLDGREVSQHAYAARLIYHLMASATTVVASVATTVILLRRGRHVAGPVTNEGSAIGDGAG